MRVLFPSFFSYVPPTFQVKDMFECSTCVSFRHSYYTSIYSCDYILLFSFSQIIFSFWSVMVSVYMLVLVSVVFIVCVFMCPCFKPLIPPMFVYSLLSFCYHIVHYYCLHSIEDLTCFWIMLQCCSMEKEFCDSFGQDAPLHWINAEPNTLVDKASQFTWIWQNKEFGWLQNEEKLIFI